MKKILISLLITVSIIIASTIGAFASGDEFDDNIGTNNGAENEFSPTNTPEISAESAILMEAKTGTILYSKQPTAKLPPASVTKIMTLLLVAEAIEEGRIKADDKVIISEYASSMGGSQIFLKEGECFTVEELVKSTVIASANDAAVALAEFVSGSESIFVGKMNQRADELGMKNTCFENVTGLDDTVNNHLTCAYDIALMSRELMKHDIIMKYSSVWQDSIRNGEFTLTNTNRLVRYYKGCTGLKTGSTDKAGFCVSATAERDDMQLIAVIMGAKSSTDRNNAAKALLDFGFSSYTLLKEDRKLVEEVPLKFGKTSSVCLYSSPIATVIERGAAAKIERVYEIPEYLTAPIKAGDQVGYISYRIDGEELARSVLFTDTNIDRAGFFDVFLQILKSIIVVK